MMIGCFAQAVFTVFTVFRIVFVAWCCSLFYSVDPLSEDKSPSLGSLHKAASASTTFLIVFLFLGLWAEDQVLDSIAQVHCASGNVSKFCQHVNSFPLTFSENLVCAGPGAPA